MRLPAGAHTAYFQADGSYDSVVLANSAARQGRVHHPAGAGQRRGSSRRRHERIATETVVAALARRRPANAWVVPVAVGLIVAQLAYRAWVSAHSYWEGDDFQLISQTFGPGGTVR